MSGKCCCVLSGNCGDGQKCDQTLRLESRPSPSCQPGQRAGTGPGLEQAGARTRQIHSAERAREHRTHTQPHPLTSWDTRGTRGTLTVSLVTSWDTWDTGPSERWGWHYQWLVTILREWHTIIPWGWRPWPRAQSRSRRLGWDTPGQPEPQPPGAQPGGWRQYQARMGSSSGTIMLRAGSVFYIWRLMWRKEATLDCLTQRSDVLYAVKSVAYISKSACLWNWAWEMNEIFVSELDNKRVEEQETYFDKTTNI